MSKDLLDSPGKEISVITVEYAPGGTDPIQRHNAHGVIYVLEGSIVMQVKGGQQVTLTAGQTFYEGPDDVHVVGRNASSTQKAKFVVFFIKHKGRPGSGPCWHCHAVDSRGQKVIGCFAERRSNQKGA